MMVLMQCVGEAVAAKGLRGLIDWVPAGGFLYDVATEALRRIRERKRSEQLREEVLKAATASFEEAKQAAEQVAREVASQAPIEERLALEMYLTQIPGAVRQSLKRTEDPSGKSVPANFALQEASDLMKRLPARPAHFRPGAALPGKAGWQLVELLGTGGFGEVWLARNPALSALKGAVKFGLDPQARDRLLRHEGTLINRVMEQGKHPNVVALLDAHLEGEAPWLMYEYVPGGDLTSLILSWQNLPPAERVNCAVRSLQTLASAVGHFHRLSPPLVHRDLKPANILVDLSQASLKVADFGIGGVAAAASLAEATRLSSTGVMMSQLIGSHTPLYASLQQQAGNPPDPRDDVHSLGVIGFQMLTGKLDATLGADYAKTLRRFAVPEPLIELLGDCAAHDPDNRPKDAAELAERLAKLAAPSTPPVSLPPNTDVVPCPNCQAKLVLKKDETRLITCGKCKHTFKPPAALTPPPPPPKEPPVERSRPTAKPIDIRREPEPEPKPRRRDDDEEDDRPRRRSREEEQPRKRSVNYGCVFGLIVLAAALGGIVYLVVSGMNWVAERAKNPFGQQKDEAKVEKKLVFPEKAKGKVADLRYSPDGRTLCAKLQDGSLQFWNAEDGTTKKDGVKDAAAFAIEVPDSSKLKGETSAADDPKGRYLATTDAKGTVHLWKRSDITLVTTLEDMGPQPAVAFTSEGRLVVGGEDGRCRSLLPDKDKKGEKWNTSTGPAHGVIVKLAVSADGRKVAAIDVAGGLYHWDPTGNGALDQYKDSGNVNAVVFVPNRKIMATAGGDGIVRFWDTFFNNVRVKAFGHTTSVMAVAANPAGDRVATADADGTIILWAVPPEFRGGFDSIDVR